MFVFGVIKVSKHLGSDFDHGQIMRPAPPVLTLGFPSVAFAGAGGAHLGAAGHGAGAAGLGGGRGLGGLKEALGMGCVGKTCGRESGVGTRGVFLPPL